MDNYRRALLYARELFLERDQAQIIANSDLKHDADYLYLNFLGEPWRIERKSGKAECIAGDPAEGGFSEGLSIYDYLCRSTARPVLSGRLCPVNALPHVAQSNPSTTDFHQPYADFFQQHIPSLQRALKEMGAAPFFKGDAACYFHVFDGFNAVFQFWEGDEEFPPSVRFLWDENSQAFLKYETLYYVMGCFLQKLKNRILEIEKNSYLLGEIWVYRFG